MSPWMIWAAIGFGLLIAELATNAFVLLFFGIAALLVALLDFVWLGLSDQTPWTLEISLFAIFGTASLLAFRKKMVHAAHASHQRFNIDQNESIQMNIDLPAGSEGQVQYQGTIWTGVNDDTVDFRAGEKVVIYKTSGIKLHLKKFKN